MKGTSLVQDPLPEERANSSSQGARLAGNAFGLALTWAAWLGVIAQDWNPWVDFALAVVGTLALIPLVFAGRRMLEHQPSLERAARITQAIHYLVAIFFGSALIAATRFGLASPAWPFPLPPWLGLAVMAASGAVLLLVVLNLVLKGSGAFAFALTQVVVNQWIYAWTRNPMVLSALAFLVGLGLWLGSGLFLVWVLVVVSPAMLVFLKVYEERELEIRFGQSYIDYKQSTPMLLPRRPRKKE